MKVTPFPGAEQRSLPVELQSSLQNFLTRRRAWSYLFVALGVALATAAVLQSVRYWNFNTGLAARGRVEAAYVDSVDAATRGPDSLNVTLVNVPNTPEFTIDSLWPRSFGRSNQGRTLEVLYSDEYPDFVRLRDRVHVPAGVQIVMAFGLLGPFLAVAVVRSFQSLQQAPHSDAWSAGVLTWELQDRTRWSLLRKPHAYLMVGEHRYNLRVNGRPKTESPTKVWVLQVGAFLVVPNNGERPRTFTGHADATP